MMLNSFITQRIQNDAILKSPSPTWLQRPPFGIPIPKNILSIRELGKNSYVFGATQTIADEIAASEWEITQDKNVRVSDAQLETVEDFFKNPNGNKETWSTILRKTVPDILEIDAGVWVKSFTFEKYVPGAGKVPDKLLGGSLSNVFAKDGGGFLVNPDIWGYMGRRADFIAPVRATQGISPDDLAHIGHAMRNGLPDQQGHLLSFGQFQTQFPHLHQLYSGLFLNRAAYFQYPNRNAQLPIPFGMREVVYMMRNPRTDTHYGRGAVEMLTDIIYTLVYGSKYNFDMYRNNNMPEGVLQLAGAMPSDIKAFRSQMQKEIRGRDINGFFRRIFFRFPITGAEVKFVPFAFTPREMEIIAQQSWFIKLLWSCFGVNADEMGFTEDSNKATSHAQSAVVKRKVINPLLQLFQESTNMEIMSEFGIKGLSFKFKDFDLDEEHSKVDLFAKEKTLGLRSTRDIAEEMEIDFDKQLEDMEKDGDNEGLDLGQESQSSLTGGEGPEGEADDSGESAGASRLEDPKGSQPARWPAAPYYHGKVKGPGRKASAAQLAEGDDLRAFDAFFRELDKELQAVFDAQPPEGAESNAGQPAA